MTSRSIVLGTAALLLMSGATPLQIGFSPTAAFAQQLTLDAAMAGNPAELDAGQLRERIHLLRDAIQNGTLTGDNRKAAQQKIKAYREVLQGLRAERREAQQDNGQAEPPRQAEPREGERTQRQVSEPMAERQAEKDERKAERQAEKDKRKAERQAQQEEQQQRKAERQAEREAQREAEQRQAEQRKAEREAQREAEQRQAEQRKAEREAQREAEQRQAEQQGDTQQRAQQDDGSALTREMTAALRDTRPASELDQAELRDRLLALRDALQSGAVPEDQRESVRARLQADREVLQARRAERTEDTTTEQPQQEERRARSEDRPQQEVDRRAREIIADNRPASDLDSNVLRERLTNNRELLGTDQLSRAERQQLREQLREDRDELRARVAARQEQQEEQEEARTPERSGSDDRTRGSDDRISGRDVTRIIEERTPSEQLTERELEERVRVLSRALNAGNITVRQAEVARLLIDRDREELRERLYADRERRRDRRRSGSYDDFFVEFEVGYRPPPVIYAAEAMPRDIQMQLVAPPRYRTQRAYSPQEIATNHDVRESMPGIEIDTLNFDFGSAEVRPEEIEKLDEIGMVIESIVAERPDEVFLIEGHTDAVGSDAANDALSQRRALAVREALLDYFIIDPENLQTVGLGERYLRINTPDPEEENRRVTVRRITPLLAGRG